MATRIEFHKHGGPEVLKAVEFTPPHRVKTKSRLKTKPSVSTTSTPIFAVGSIRHRLCQAGWEPKRQAS
jgi:hypothetical protein